LCPGHRRDASREVALDDDHLRTGVGELVSEEVALVRRIHRHLDGAELQRGEEADDLRGTVLQQRGDTIAFPDAELAQGACKAIALGLHAAGGVLVTLEVEIRPVGIGNKTVAERLEHRRLRPFGHRPDTSVTSLPSSKAVRKLLGVSDSARVHRYTVSSRWRGSTGAGHDAYDRS